MCIRDRHHANIVPWLMLAAERDIELRYIPLADDHTLDLTDLDRLAQGLGPVSYTHLDVYKRQPPR